MIRTSFVGVGFYAIFVLVVSKVFRRFEAETKPGTSLTSLPRVPPGSNYFQTCRFRVARNTTFTHDLARHLRDILRVSPYFET